MSTLVILNVADGQALVYAGFNLTDEQLDKLEEHGLPSVNRYITVPIQATSVPTAQVEAAATLREVFGPERIWYQTPRGEEYCIELNNTVWLSMSVDGRHFSGPDDPIGEYNP